MFVWFYTVISDIKYYNIYNECISVLKLTKINFWSGICDLLPMHGQYSLEYWMDGCWKYATKLGFDTWLLVACVVSDMEEKTCVKLQ